MFNVFIKFRQFKLDVPPVRPVSLFRTFLTGLGSGLVAYVKGIGFKLTVIIVSLVAITALGISLVVISIVNAESLQSMLRRGAAISMAAASPAGYSILTDDLLALDNLVARISSSQPDLDYIAIIDNSNTIIAHNQLGLSGTLFHHLEGVPVSGEHDIKTSRINRDGTGIYEFSAPITFANKTIGQVVTGLNESHLATVRSKVQHKIILVVMLLLPFSIFGAVILARLFTRPIKQLSTGVANLRTGMGNVTVPVTAHDELAILTRNFNEMATKIQAQRQSLINYSEELKQSYADIVRILAAALDARDNYTYGHSSRVASLAVALGRKMSLEEEELSDLEMACMLHDIGKIRIPDAILNKPGKLSTTEYQNIKEHPEHGVGILDLSDSLKKYIPAVRHHHESHDGNGYPDNLAGDDIPLQARIIAITDAYDAMTSSRPYRPGMSREHAVTEIMRFRGKQFKPDLVDTFIETLEDYTDVCDLPLAGEVTC